MSDITKCTDRHCSSRCDCWRYVSPSNALQSYADFNREENAERCDAFEPAQDGGSKPQISLAIPSR